jgi:hypothetical protein
MLQTMALFFILTISEALIIPLFPVAVMKISIYETLSSKVTTSYPYMQACKAQIGST